MNAILSIKPEFVAKIISGEKIYEFRKIIFKKKINKILIYSTMPVGKLIGEFTVKDVVHGDKAKVWKITKDKAGISFDFFSEYYLNRNTAYAIKIDQLIVYDTPVNPYLEIPGFIAPQSFRYINDYEI